MKYIVIPPYSDPTLSYVPLPGWQVYDLMQEFVARILEEARMVSPGQKVFLSASTSPTERNRQLLLAAGQQLLAHAHHPHRWLRACGAILAGQPHSSVVHLRLDDLEIVDGTTEATADVLRAASEPAPYSAELQRACSEFEQAETLRLLIDTDKQLPAAVWLVRTYASHPGLEVSGRFALEHATALRSLPEFHTLRFVPMEQSYHHRVVVPGIATPLWWHTFEEVQENTNPWAGAVAIRSLLAPEDLLKSGIRVAVVAFTALGETVLDAGGQEFSHADLCSATTYLRTRGIRVVAEWLIGAPGINEKRIEESVSALAAACFFEWLAGVRLFHWPSNEQQPLWGKVPVELAEPATHLNLARTYAFSAPGTLSPEQRLYWLDKLARRLMQDAPLSPGRVAGAYCTPPPETLHGAPGSVGRDPDSALVECTREESKDEWFAVNLRLQNIIALDYRLAKALLSLDHFEPRANGLAVVPEKQRDKVVTYLCQHGILMEA